MDSIYRFDPPLGYRENSAEVYPRSEFSHVLATAQLADYIWGCLAYVRYAAKHDSKLRAEFWIPEMQREWFNLAQLLKHRSTFDRLCEANRNCTVRFEEIAGQSFAEVLWLTAAGILRTLAVALEIDAVDWRAVDLRKTSLPSPIDTNMLSEKWSSVRDLLLRAKVFNRDWRLLQIELDGEMRRADGTPLGNPPAWLSSADSAESGRDKTAVRKKRPRGANRDLVLSALCLLHRYSNGHVDKAGPMTQDAIKAVIEKDGLTIHKSQISDAMNQLFSGGMSAYKRLCRDDHLGSQLRLHQGEYQAVVREFNESKQRQENFIIASKNS